MTKTKFRFKDFFLNNIFRVVRLAVMIPSYLFYFLSSLPIAFDNTYRILFFIYLAFFGIPMMIPIILTAIRLFALKNEAYVGYTKIEILSKTILNFLFLIVYSLLPFIANSLFPF